MGDGEKTYAIVLDEVSDVADVPEESLRPFPEFETTMSGDYLTAIATLDEKMVMLLDANKIVSLVEVEQLDEAV